MPWKVKNPMSEKEQFIQQWLRKEFSFIALCEQFEIAPKTGYKWVERFKEGGLEALADRSHARHTPPPWSISLRVRDLILNARVAHPTWGPRKLRAWLESRHPRIRLPAPSTIGDLLKRNGLVQERRRRAKPVRPSVLPFDDTAGPNAVFCIDFKGWFRTRDGARCNPFTVTDANSRFLLCCQHLERGTSVLVQEQLERLFQEYGLPKVIHSDNGAPFGSQGLGGLSQLSVWLMSFGVDVSFIKPGHPEQNGRHERMHRTLELEVASQPAASLKLQQRAFDRFRHEYNWERPHEALENKTPGSVHVPSPRRWPPVVEEPEYPLAEEVRRVRGTGEIKWRGKRVFVGEAFIGEMLGLVPREEGRYELMLRNRMLGVLDEREGRIRKA